jgi:hypothetical protein
MSKPFKPKTVVDVKRMTRSDITALYKHCMRIVGQDDHIIKAQSKDNKWLFGDDTNFLNVVDDYIREQGATLDKRNVKPATALVLQASPEYFRRDYHRDDPEGFGKYDTKKLNDWVLANVKWLKNTFGSDCIAAHLHVDERTPHIHAVIVPMFEKAPTMPKNKRKGETQARFDLRVERANKKKGRKVVSHHKHHLFGAGRKSYEKVVDSYAAAVEHLGIERSERGSEATPTTKQEWARLLYKKSKEIEQNLIGKQKRQKLEDESFEFGAAALIDDKIRYAEAKDGRGEGLLPSTNWPQDKHEQDEIKSGVKPAKTRIVAFAKKIRDFTNSSLEKAKMRVFEMLKAVEKREAAVKAKEIELAEREEALGLIEGIDDTWFENGEMSEANEQTLRENGIIQDKIEHRPVLEVREEIVRVPVR